MSNLTSQKQVAETTQPGQRGRCIVLWNRDDANFSRQEWQEGKLTNLNVAPHSGSCATAQEHGGRAGLYESNIGSSRMPADGILA